ncbi:hypothetical protein BDQ17DRAFT_1168295, partial [Cyathus striatus]
YNICALQEPYIDFRGKSCANTYWCPVYPSFCAPEGCVPRSLLLINMSISTNAWAEIPVQSHDITAVCL